MAKITISCDGAASNNGKESVRAGGGAVIETPEATFLVRISHETIAEKANKYGYQVTNNTAELIALGCALNHLYRIGVDPAETSLHIRMDSLYAVGLLRKDHPSKAKANVAIVEALRLMLGGFQSYTMEHSRGHSGDPRNETADSLANEGKTLPDKTTKNITKNEKEF